ncbi:MAG: hypothetical protein C0407_00030 [Desulfobacca sp.]|nr:hypothetical protein [Desulfobacca sp.]
MKMVEYFSGYNQMKGRMELVPDFRRDDVWIPAFARLPADRLFGYHMVASSKTRRFGFRPIGYADLSGRLPEGVG